MATFTSRTKKNNVSDNEKNTSNGNNPSATLPSPVAQLFRDDQSTDDFKQEDGSLAIKGIHSFGEIGIPSSDNASSKQLKSSPSFPAIQRKSQNNNAPVPVTNNKTGLPNNLKSGVEQLSGKSIDDVKVHYNSKEPKQLNALAYAKGTEIHVGPGNEKHLPHEAWHVVQQKQGRVQPTKQLKGKVPLNDDKSLENEADLMGEKANHLISNNSDANNTVQAKMENNSSPIVQRVLSEEDKAMLGTVKGVSNNKSAFEGGSKPPTDNITSAVPAVEEPVSAAPAVEEPVSAPAVEQEPVSAAPAVEQEPTAPMALDDAETTRDTIYETNPTAPMALDDAETTRDTLYETKPTAPMALEDAETTRDAISENKESSSESKNESGMLGKMKDGAAWAGGKVKEGASFVGKKASENKFAIGAAGVKKVASTVAERVSGSEVLGNSVGGMVGGGLTLGKGLYDMNQGRNEKNKAQDYLKNNNKNLDDKELTDNRIQNRIAEREGKDKMAKGGASAVSGALNLTAGALTASGVGIPAAAVLTAASTAVSVGSGLTGMAVQSGRDKEARRLRSSDELLADKGKKNQEREDKIAGSKLNPLNWGAKLSRLTGIGDKDEKLIGTKNSAEMLKARGKTEEDANTNFLSRKEKEYEGEGWDRTDINKKGKDQAAIKWESGFFGGFKKTKFDAEDIGVSKGLSSDGIEKRKKEAEEKAAKEEKEKAASKEKKWWPF